ncbi:hypothetical protein SNE40_014572 [Patella caerulea]|uniref:Fork-head domain-containing protein n=1 Tax=Patella caerulea TaxID=87958 RepID=A0AAN8JH66_PATCE
MSSVSRNNLAKRLLKNWFTKNPLDSFNTGSYDIDDSLTGLRWLQNLDVSIIKKPTDLPIVSENIPAVTEVKSNIQVERVIVQPPVIKSSFPIENKNYKNNSCIKPPYSYATLISMAINETKEKKINISSIYKWITDNFSYYKMADSHWKNSIRHNLSLNKRFEKVSRLPNESSKGGYWKINPEFDDVTRANLPKKRTNVIDGNTLVPSKRIKMEEDTLAVINLGDNSAEGNASQIYYDMDEGEEESICKKDFNWSSVLQQDIEINGVQIKTENILDDDDYGKMSDFPVNTLTSVDVTSYPMSSSVPNCDVNPDDLTCFDDLLVFNLNDQPKDQQLTDDCALDLTTDTNGDHDWWQKAFECSDEASKIQDMKNESDCNEINIAPLFNNDDDVDICNLFHVDHIF